VGDVRISVDNDDAGREADSLAEWLRRERDLPTTVDLVPRPAVPGELGTAVDIWVAAASSGRLAVALIRSLRSWFTARATRVTIELSTDKGPVTLDARNIDSDETRALLAQILDFYDDGNT
jgi:Effector Associated Constant Component 1